MLRIILYSILGAVLNYNGVSAVENLGGFLAILFSVLAIDINSTIENYVFR